MIHNTPPLQDTPRGPDPIVDTGTAMTGMPYDMQMMRRLAGGTQFTEAMGDVVDLVEQMDRNRIANMAVKQGRDDLRGN